MGPSDISRAYRDSVGMFRDILCVLAFGLPKYRLLLGAHIRISVRICWGPYWRPLFMAMRSWVGKT